MNCTIDDIHRLEHATNRSIGELRVRLRDQTFRFNELVSCVQFALICVDGDSENAAVGAKTVVVPGNLRWAADFALSTLDSLFDGRAEHG